MKEAKSLNQESDSVYRHQLNLRLILLHSVSSSAGRIPCMSAARRPLRGGKKSTSRFQGVAALGVEEGPVKHGEASASWEEAEEGAEEKVYAEASRGC